MSVENLPQLLADVHEIFSKCDVDIKDKLLKFYGVHHRNRSLPDILELLKNVHPIMCKYDVKNEYFKGIVTHIIISLTLADQSIMKIIVEDDLAVVISIDLTGDYSQIYCDCDLGIDLLEFLSNCSKYSSEKELNEYLETFGFYKFDKIEYNS